MNNKVYRIKFGSRTKNGEESYNIDSVTVKCSDAMEALGVCGDYFLKKEKEYMKEKMEIFVESIEFITEIDFE